MLTQRQLFINHVAQTTEAPLALEIIKAEGNYMFDVDGKKYLDLISGISVSNVGHCHPKVVEAIKNQVDTYMHLMVYGEFVQSPQVQFATKLAEVLPESLSSVYFVNSGAEAIEGAMKLAKRVTGRREIISFKNAYHGSTHGSLSIMGSEEFKNAYRPLLPETRLLEYNNEEELSYITENTAAVFVEAVQGEAGAIVPKPGYLELIRKRCDEVGALMVLDEIQTGFGRTGSLFAFEQFGFTPDILCLAKGMGGGMPIGAFVSSLYNMNQLSNNPILGHITTFGGHPVTCAAGLATLNVLLEGRMYEMVQEKELLFKELLVHPKIKSVSGKGLLLAVKFDSFEENKTIIDKCIENGVITDWFLFADNALRIAPPLTITIEEIRNACKIILNCIDN